MQHPPYPLSRRARIAIMLSLIALFFILSPLIILYTAGYRYSVGDGVLTTGSLSVDATPGTAHIFVDGVEIDKELRLDGRASIRKPNLAVGTYHVRISEPGYRTWEKAVDVKNNQTTYVRDIQLLRDGEAEELLTESVLDAVSFAPSGALSFLTYREDGNLLYEVRNLATSDAVARASGTVDTAQVLWAENGTSGVLVAETGTSTVAVSFAADESTPSWATTYGTQDTTALQWSPEIQALFIEQEGRIIRVDATGTSSVAVAPTSSVWFMTGSTAGWFFDAENTILTLEGTANDADVPVDAALEHILFASDEQLLARVAGGLVLLRKDKQEWHEELIPGATALYNPMRSEWIVSTPWEIWTLTPSGETALVYRTSKPIQAVRPLDRFGRLLIAEQNGLLVYDPRYLVGDTFVQGELNNMTFDPTPRVVYFTKQINGHLKLFARNL